MIDIFKLSSVTSAAKLRYKLYGLVFGKFSAFGKGGMPLPYPPLFSLEISFEHSLQQYCNPSGAVFFT
jgi:hypothetical protein